TTMGSLPTRARTARNGGATGSPMPPILCGPRVAFMRPDWLTESELEYKMRKSEKATPTGYPDCSLHSRLLMLVSKRSSMDYQAELICRFIPVIRQLPGVRPI